ncbi:MAG: hypothetical protein LBH43_03190 [Treponema sp.]|jgi:hypothetical protein|nr:hypothetical protein [Treponema sp.]
MSKNDFIEVEIDTDITTLRRLGTAAMTVATQNGFAEIAHGVFLYDSEYLIKQQKRLPDTDTGKNIDYTTAPFWIALHPEQTISPCVDPMDVVDFLDIVEDTE